MRCLRFNHPARGLPPEQPAQVHDHLLVDVFPTRRLKHFSFGTQRHSEFAVALFGGRSDEIEQRQNFTPLDIAAGRMAEDFLESISVMTTEVHVAEPSCRAG